MSPNQIADLSTRTPQMVGRNEDLERLEGFLHSRGESHFVYYWAQGGLGKTRLLEELQRRVERAGTDYYTTRIIDLYHTDTHSSSDVERLIVNNLDPESRYFKNYRRARRHYEVTRERGSDGELLEKLREELSRFFIEDSYEMARDARKLVICFDTIEVLQYESSIVEEKAGLDTVNTRLRTWMLNNLPKMANVLVVFAGRPKKRSLGETVDHQARLLADMSQAFGGKFFSKELPPFSQRETEELIRTLTNGQMILSPEHLPLVHQLTAGRPVFIHLLVDLLQVLSPEPRTILEWLTGYADLVNMPEGDSQLETARETVQRKILNAIFNEAGALGGYLGRIALIPKGVDGEILQKVLGVPQDEAVDLIAGMRKLSFVKEFTRLPDPEAVVALAGAELVHSNRLFLHDEMYSLLTLPGLMSHLRMNERSVINTLISAYYTPLIRKIQAEIAAAADVPTRTRLRERLQKLQVEQLYYLLVWDPRQGYARYRELTLEALRHRWTGFAMRVLDEFLRVYNEDRRRPLFAEVGISHEQVVRESAELWVERFRQLGQGKRAMAFAEMVMADPGSFYIHPEADLGILSNICAHWSFELSKAQGYRPEIVERSLKFYTQLPELSECAENQILPKARLAMAIGYQYRLDGQLALAADYYAQARAAYERLRSHRDELAGLLNNLAYVYALQGRMGLAIPLALHALKLNKTADNDYNIGLTLSSLSRIYRMRRDYSNAIEYGEESLALFKGLNDPHGICQASLALAQGLRSKARDVLEKNHKPESAAPMLAMGEKLLRDALETAHRNELKAHIPLLNVELGKVYRENGKLIRMLHRVEEAFPLYQRGLDLLRDAGKSESLPKREKIDLAHDLAEMHFDFGYHQEALKQLDEVDALLGGAHRIVLGQPLPEAERSREEFVIFGKAELLRGQVLFDQQAARTEPDPQVLQEAMRHYVLAYIYFMLFSADSEESETMIHYIYNQLIRFRVEVQWELTRAAQAWVDQYDWERIDINGFFQSLQQILGV